MTRCRLIILQKRELARRPRLAAARGTQNAGKAPTDGRLNAR